MLVSVCALFISGLDVDKIIKVISIKMWPEVGGREWAVVSATWSVLTPDDLR